MKYIVCFNSLCGKREHCLRWQAGLYAPAGQRHVMCINPNFKLDSQGEGECMEYRDDKPIRIPKGMKHFYDNMPGQIERSIKSELISRFTRVGYYDMRKGKRQITPDIENEIKKICESHGWVEPLVFDEYVEEVLW